jgi:aryl-alcohol dehydrogenase-like predicted oxidoreductase
MIFPFATVAVIFCPFMVESDMQYKTLGKSELRVSEIGFGCMSLGEDDGQNQQILHRALESGINLFDTADLYAKGRNEETLGRFFKGIRQQVVLATKVGNQWRPDGSGWDWNPRKDYIMQAVEASLKRLQTDYIDLYQLHGGTLDDPIDETIEAFELLMQQGKIRAYGISSIRPNVIREYVNRSRIASVMMQYSLLDRRPEESCLDVLRENQIGVLSRGSVAQGLLINKPPAPYLNYAEKEVSQAAKAVRALVNKERTEAQIAIRYVLHHPSVTSAVLGIRTLDQLEEGIGVVGIQPFSSEEIRWLSQAIRANQYEQHR